MRDHPLASRLGPLALLTFLLACMLPALIVVQRTSHPAQAADSLDTGTCAAAGSPTATATGTPTPATPVPTCTATATTTTTATSTQTATATASATASPTSTPIVKVTVGVTPGSIVAGSTISVVGSGYLPNEAIQIQLATTGTAAGTLNLASGHADASGGFAAAGITIPSGTPAGSYQILAVGLASLRIGGTPLAVTAPTATLSANPTTFAPNDTVQVSWTNYKPGEAVALVLASASGAASVPLGQATADGNGQFNGVGVRVPFGVPAGSLTIVATGQQSGRQASVAVTVNAAAATLAVTPNTARPGESIAVSGTHFQPGETVTVDLVALSTSTRLGTAQVKTDGTFSISALTLPQNTPEGTVSLVATGTTSHLSASAQLKAGALPASVTLTPGTITAGGTLGVHATGFIPGETVTVGLVGSNLAAVTLLSAIAGTSGSVAIATLTVPSYVPAGSYQLVVSGQTSGRVARGTLIIQAPAPATPLVSIVGITPVNGVYNVSPGGLIELAGSNLPGGAAVTLVLTGSNGTSTLAVVHVASNGTLAPVGITIPAVTQEGGYTLHLVIAGQSVASVKIQVARLAPKLAVSGGTLSPGAAITVSGTGFAPGEQIVLALNGSALVTRPSTVLADGRGSFSVAVTVPGTLGNGLNTITASGAASRASASVAVQGSLPVTTRYYFPHGDTTGDHRTVIALLNAGGTPAVVKMTFLYQNAPERSYTQTVPAHTHANVDLALAAGAGRNVSIIVESDRQIGAQSIIYYGAGDTSSASGASAPSGTWYLAEGYTGGSFREYLTIMNANTSFATVDVRFLPFNGKPPVEQRFTVRPRSDIRIDAGQYVPNQSTSAIVTADKGVVVERSMRFGAGRRGAHDKIGVVAASTVWQFAEGESAANRQTFLTILNPNPAAPASVTATFYDRTGKPVGQKTIVVGALRRGNIKLNDLLPNAQVAAVVTSNVPVVVERPLYEGPADLGAVRSGSVVFGRNGGAVSWTFPGGSTTNGTVTKLYLFNPNLSPTQLMVTVYTNAGATRSETLTIGANAVGVVDAGSIVGAADFGAVVRSTNGQPFIAELSQLNAARGQASSTQGIAE